MRRKLIEVLLTMSMTIGFTWLLKPLGLWIDEQVMTSLGAVHEVGQRSSLYQAADIVTMLGSTTVFTLVSLGILAFLLRKRQYPAIVFIGIFFLGGVLLNTAVKLLIVRPRPYGIVIEMDVIGEAFNLISYSFPSGHTFRAFLLALGLSYVLSRFTYVSFNVKRWLYVVLILLALAVMVSRVVIGVHYPTDVLGGAAYASIWLLILLRLFPGLKGLTSG